MDKTFDGKFLKQVADVLAARAQGAVVQASFGGLAWRDLEDGELFRVLQEDGCAVRVKPVQRYRPFMDVDEMLSEWRSRFQFDPADPPVVWLRSKERDGRVWLVDGYNTKLVNIHAGVYDMRELLNMWTFLDGSPCGVDAADGPCDCDHD